MENNEILENEVVTEEAPAKSKKSLIGLILGIASIAFNTILSWFPFALVISLVTALVAKAQIKLEPESGLKKGAKITSTIGLILTAVMAVILVVSFIIGFILGLRGALA